ncbi:MAG: 5-deoxy-glucuronate isomerase [Trueperaceae bacterium]|nr:5-deoxy-glucuronate isomerase [Trueperaceae bacterium]
MTYFHQLAKDAGLVELKEDACNLLGFAKLNLAAGESYEAEVAANREIMLVMLSGKADVVVNGRSFENVGGRPTVFAGNAHSVYLPKSSSYTITAKTRCEIALPSAPSTLSTEAYEIKPSEVQTGTWGTLNFTRYFRQIAVEGDSHAVSSLIIGETITPSGNWSTFPPHKHEVEENGEAFHEEMYYFRNASPDGYGLAQHYSPERGYDNTYRVTDDSLLSMPHGYHTYAAAPGSASYYLWFLAGNGRTQGVSFDPRSGWVQKMVGIV